MFQATTREKEKLLGFLRNGNYVHPGEEDAIDLIFSDVPKNPKRRILDIGCGIGGTANYIHASGYGQVVGVDRNSGVIQEAKSQYPNVEFRCCDALDIEQEFKGEQFDLVCMINSFFYMEKQDVVLEKIHALLQPEGIVKIFEYTDRTKGEKKLTLLGDQDESNFSPIRMDTLPSLFKTPYFSVHTATELNAEYEKWYTELYEKIEKNKADILSKFSVGSYMWAESIFRGILSDIKANDMGGCILTIKKEPASKLQHTM